MGQNILKMPSSKLKARFLAVVYMQKAGAPLLKILVWQCFLALNYFFYTDGPQNAVHVAQSEKRKQSYSVRESH